MWSFLVGAATPDVVKDAAKSATSAVNYAGKAVQDATSTVMTGASQVANSAVTYLKAPKSSHVDIQKKYEALKLGVTVAELPRVTPEQRWQAEQLKEFKTLIRERHQTLTDEIMNLRSSCFAIIHKSEIHLKQLKDRELQNLASAPNWDAFMMQAETLLHSPEVIDGRHSRTKELLEKIVATKFDEKVNVEEASVIPRLG
jgi:hypothetical protein